MPNENKVSLFFFVRTDLASKEMVTAPLSIQPPQNVNGLINSSISCWCCNAHKPKKIHVLESKRKILFACRAEHWSVLKWAMEVLLVFHNGEKVNQKWLIKNRMHLLWNTLFRLFLFVFLSLFYSCCKMRTSYVDCIYFFLICFLFFLLDWLSDVFWHEQKCCCIFKSTVTPSSDAVQIWLYFIFLYRSFDYIYIYSVYLYMYEYRYIYIYSR